LLQRITKFCVQRVTLSFGPRFGFDELLLHFVQSLAFCPRSMLDDGFGALDKRVNSKPQCGDKSQAEDGRNPTGPSKSASRFFLFQQQRGITSGATLLQEEDGLLKTGMVTPTPRGVGLPGLLPLQHE